MREKPRNSKSALQAIAAQLRRSFFLINTTIVIFFVLYLVQAYVLYKRAAESDQWVIHTNDVLRNIKSADANAMKMESAVRGFLLTHDAQYSSSIKNYTDNIRLDLSHLQVLSEGHPIQEQRVNALTALVEQKIVLSENLVNTAKNEKVAVAEPGLLLQVNKSISQYIDQLQDTEYKLLAERTEKNRYYSKSRVIFSLLSYVLISIFLLVTLYKINSGIRKRTMAEERARLNEAKYKVLVEDSGLTMIVINSKGDIKFASQNVTELLGFKPDELTGMSLMEGTPRKFKKNAAEIINSLNTTGNYNTTVELQLFTKKGTSKWVSCRVFPVSRENGEMKEWQIVIWDIEEEKKLQLELEALETESRAQQKLIQDIINNIPSVVYIKDLEGRYVLMNNRMSDVIGKPSTDILGRTDADLMPGSDRYFEHKKAFEKVLTQKTMISFEEIIPVNGEDKYFWFTKFPLIDEEGNVKNICVLASEITERKETELKLITARKDADHARIAQESFLANMSHEIRTPMNGIIGMGNLLMSTPLNEEQKEFTENIQESAHNLLAIINDLLDFSKIRSGKFQLENSAFRLRSILSKTIYPLQYKAEEKLITLDLHIRPEVPDVLIGDGLRLQQILINLIGNAIKFTSQGGVRVNIGCDKTSDTQINLKVTVTDTGIGIPDTKLDYVFESFTQNNAQTSRKYGGTGLGLAIVKQLVELQNGTISVKSILTQGSVFAFNIPYTVGTGETVEEHKIHAPQESTGLLNGIKVLVAEDNIINQKVVKNTLMKQGAAVSLAVNGREVIEWLKKDSFDVILMDLQMPEVDGYRATQHIREVLKNNIPILAMTADALKGEAEKCFEAGMTGFISKPFEPNDLYRQILKAKTDGSQLIISEQQNNQSMEQPLLDLSYLQELSGNDPQYISDVIGIFLDNTPDGLVKLDDLIRNTNDWEATWKQAHFLKSSVGIVKVRGMHEALQQIEHLAKQEKDKETIIKYLDEIQATFSEAMPLIVEAGKMPG